jgi:hypothetical protein
MGYIDKKVTIWKRFHIQDEKITAFLKAKGSERAYPTEDLPDESYEEEFLYETEESLSYSDNGNQTTIEIFTEDHKMVWSNKPIQVLRDEKINTIIKEK